MMAAGVCNMLCVLLLDQRDATLSALCRTIHQSAQRGDTYYNTRERVCLHYKVHYLLKYNEC